MSTLLTDALVAMDAANATPPAHPRRREGPGPHQGKNDALAERTQIKLHILPIK